MSKGEARLKGIHLRHLGKCNFSKGEPLWLHHHCSWAEAEANVPREGKGLPVLWGRLREGRDQKLSAPDHMDV